MPHSEKRRLLKYLNDAFLATNDLIDLKLSNAQQLSDNYLKWIIERGIEIISEALKRASVLKPDLQITDLQKIFATRNKIAHEYDLIDITQLYIIVNKHLPILTKELCLLIETLENDDSN